MSRVLAITSTGPSVTLDGSGRGTVTFTVTNTGDQPLQVRARLVPEGAAEAGWLSVTGGDERRMEPQATEQLAVQVMAPPGEHAGRHSFRLDAFSVENPDDDYVEGPSVAFEVAAVEPVKKAFPWWIPVVGGVLAIALVALLWPSPPPALGEPCADECAEGLACHAAEGSDAGVCVGEVGYEGCEAGQCGEGLECSIENGNTTGRCVGLLGSTCPTPGDCGKGLVCEERVCLGGPLFPCADDSQCGSGLVCWSDHLCQTYADDPVDGSEACAEAYGKMVREYLAGSVASEKLEKLDEGSQDFCGEQPSVEPLRCLHRTLKGGVDLGKFEIGGEPLSDELGRSKETKVMFGLLLCQQSTDSDQVILCFQQEIARGQDYFAATRKCNLEATEAIDEFVEVLTALRALFSDEDG